VDFLTFMSVREIDGVVDATVWAAPGGEYADPNAGAWLSLNTGSLVSWSYWGIDPLPAGQNYGYFSYWCAESDINISHPFYRDGASQGRTTPAPEPGTLLMVLLGLVGMLIGRRLRHRPPRGADD